MLYYSTLWIQYLFKWECRHNYCLLISMFKNCFEILILKTIVYSWMCSDDLPISDGVYIANFCSILGSDNNRAICRKMCTKMLWTLRLSPGCISLMISFLFLLVRYERISVLLDFTEIFLNWLVLRGETFVFTVCLQNANKYLCE